MGDEVDKIYVQLKQYEADIKQSNRKLEEMFQANVNYYHELVRYILAGEQGAGSWRHTSPSARRIWRPQGTTPSSSS